ncbi:EAL domain-containing protein [Persephonella sp.]
MRKERILFQNGTTYAYELLGGKPKNYCDDFYKFSKACSLASNHNGIFYHINIYPKTLVLYQKSISKLVAERKNVVVELVEINSSVSLDRLKKIIREENIKIAIDDFGRCSSNFDRLELPNIKTVKFDKSFWLNKSAEYTVRSIISVLKERQILTVAEMVETQTEFNKAKEMGFDLFQGFYFKKAERLRDCYVC